MASLRMVVCMVAVFTLGCARGVADSMHVTKVEPGPVGTMQSDALTDAASDTAMASDVGTRDASPSLDAHVVDAASTDASSSVEVCALVSEGQSAVLTCPSGWVVRDVLYASYGSVQGACGIGTGPRNGSCHASNSLTVVGNACRARASCSVGANNSVFGDPCRGTVKKLGIRVRCAR